MCLVDDKILPSKFHVVGYSVVAVISVLLIMAGNTEDLASISFWLLVLIGCIVLLCFELKIVHFSRDIICIRHLVFRTERRILWACVRCVEFVHWHGEYRMFITIDDCPSFSESYRSMRAYRCGHPLKLIDIPVPANRIDEYLNLVKKYHQSITVIEKW